MSIPPAGDTATVAVPVLVHARPFQVAMGVHGSCNPRSVLDCASAENPGGSAGGAVKLKVVFPPTDVETAGCPNWVVTVLGESGGKALASVLATVNVSPV